MELFSLLATLCLLVLMNDEWRRGWPPFTGGEEGGPWKMPPPLMESTNCLQNAI
jgi:hypothetical protein